MSIPRGTVALVTGGSRGIGRAIALELHGIGCKLAINHLGPEGEGRAVRDEIRRAGGTAEVFLADVGNPDSVATLVQKVEQSLGPIGVLVNNAGIARDRTLKKMSIEEWDEVLRVNLTGVFLCTRAVAPGMSTRSFGRIVSISSIVAGSGAFGQANYAASKAGILGFTRSCALELARNGVTVNAVCPGYIETAMLAAVPEKVRQSVLERVPVGRLGRPEDVARCVRFLVAEGEYITGQALNVNGGLLF
jgi:NAD(P)-dependent dehydrogenase (short-subunit alcohol dehydrogenase family)